MKLANLIAGKWIYGAGTGTALSDPTLGHELARVSSEGIDYAEALTYARNNGGQQLRKMNYAARAGLLKAIASELSAHRADYLEIALANSGSNAADATVDIDGAIFTLNHYARIGAALGESSYLLDGEVVSMSKDGTFSAQHIQVPVRGAAVLINAFNFPAWGLWEKAAPALLSGVAVVAKPATATAWLAQRMVEDIDRAGLLPTGALSIICGSARELLDHLEMGDVVSFTGSAETAERVRSHPAVIEQSIRLNIEADSLNSAILGPDALPGSEEFDLLIREVVREMTVKAGQKCTAIRRILVPSEQFTAIAERLTDKLTKIGVGNPRHGDVRMGPLISRAQQQTAIAGIARLREQTTVLHAGGEHFSPIEADSEVGAFVPPTLLACMQPLTAPLVHSLEVFGPVATLMSYDGSAQQACAIARLGKGSLVTSLYSFDTAFNRACAVDLAESHGRVLVVNRDNAKSHTGHGNVMPMCLHGGPGRAGGGEELGGVRALDFYHQRSVIQGPTELVAEIRAGGTSTSR
jgi:3,4-dehydroadipyl-CoA semialdehyde dehydrogenase